LLTSACLRLEDYKKEILSNIRAPGLICPDTFFFFFLPCRFGGRQIHASEDDGSVNHALIRDYDAEVSRLDRFGEELEESA